MPGPRLLGRWTENEAQPRGQSGSGTPVCSPLVAPGPKPYGTFVARWSRATRSSVEIGQKIDQRGEVLGDRLPEHIEVDVEVVVDEPIPGLRRR